MTLLTVAGGKVDDEMSVYRAGNGWIVHAGSYATERVLERCDRAGTLAPAQFWTNEIRTHIECARILCHIGSPFG